MAHLYRKLSIDSEGRKTFQASEFASSLAAYMGFLKEDCQMDVVFGNDKIIIRKDNYYTGTFYINIFKED